jgi:hypothetical protein
MLFESMNAHRPRKPIYQASDTKTLKRSMPSADENHPSGAGGGGGGGGGGGASEACEAFEPFELPPDL